VVGLFLCPVDLAPFLISFAMPEQLEMPLRSWSEGDTLRAQSGAALQKWGSVEQARKLLWGCGKNKVIELVRGGSIQGFKAGPAPNSPIKVDLVTVWRYKQEVEAGGHYDL
jgi:hypothetical protein